MARKPTTKLPAELTNEIASTRDGQDITQPWTTALKQPRDTRLLGAVDWGAYDEILRDDRVKSCVEQRIRAVVSAEWDVLAGDDEDPRSVEAAAKLKENLGEIGIDRTTEKMGWACFYGIQVAEVIWGPPVDGIIPIAALKVRHARRFRYDKDEALRLIKRGNPQGEIVPDRKFWVTRTGATNDDELYGVGLAYWLYWPVFFKRNAVRFWNIFLKKFGNPTIKATYRRGTPKEDIAKILAMIQSASEDSGFAVPEGVLVELLQATRSGTGDYSAIYDKMDAAIATIILSQTMTTQDGSSHSQAKVHADVKLEIVKADADMNCESFNAGPARWWTDMNYGADVAAPKLVRLVDEEADLKLLAETDAILATQGWVRREDSFQDAYGDGYEKKPEPAPPVNPDVSKPGTTAAEAPANANDNPAAVDPAKKDVASFAATDPRPLYVYRSLKNSAELLKWAKAQGFTSTLPAADLHCTITYSKRPVDWFKMGGTWGQVDGQLIVPAGGPRVVGMLGENATVLHFACADIEWRHESMVDAGASWDYPEFHPHITISYDGAPADLTTVEPYQGKLVFGPEIFEPLDDNWQAGISEASFAEPATGDVIDQIAGDLLAEQGWRPLSPQLKAILTAIEASGDPASLDEALLKSLDTADSAALTMVLARASFATRIGAEGGVDA